MKKEKKIKPTPKALLKTLNSYVNKFGIAKTAVVLEYKDVNAIRNWLTRNEIPESKRELIKNINLYCARVELI